MSKFESRLTDRLTDWRSRHLHREQLTLQSPQSVSVVVDDRSLSNFSSNDYLGLANTSDTINLIKEEFDDYGFGSGSSHLISGHNQVHQQLENALTDFFGRDSTLLFSSGYMANLALMQTLAQKGDLIIADKLNHASLIDGAILSAAETTRYAHCDLSSLEKRLQKSKQEKWVVTDSVFSMDGDIAPLDEVAKLCNKYSAHLIVDDAHGIGVLGQEGKGCIELFKFTHKEIPVLMGTFGKALGGYGAFVSGSRNLIEYLIQFARPYIYTTAMPAIIAAGNLKNLQLMNKQPELRKKLAKNISYFRAKCAEQGILLTDSITPIQPILIGHSERLLTINQLLRSNGILVGAIREPSVPKNGARLRVTLSASHSSNCIDNLITQLVACGIDSL